MRRLLVAVLTATALLGLASPALAHNVLVSSDPAKGASLQEGPQRVTLTFDQYVQSADVNQVAVTGPDGSQWAEGAVEVKGNVVTAPLRPLGPAGEYTLGFRILSADGHAVSDEIKFTLAKAGTGTPAAADAARSGGTGGGAADGDSGGVPLWVWIAGAVVLLALGLVFALRAGKEPTKS
ncbi:copper resistance CopC family protein [Amycolatopsis sp. 195334CR]|uniref:copper resistance CopC family protein n=1 Tax=Amycolatopsis sp. 195334CR TaxID=2814588 RepID=UPI001A8E8DEC|nr:copper resistance CopC family protein [Amycolatopsis sp. 195334CR]MBN6035502.1 copper resistance protein CopC [Amycolatopsis sp. 195334CR]